MTQSKCINILKALAQQKDFLPACGPQFEQVCTPVLALLQHADKITFEDDICIIIKSMIKRSRAVSPTLFEALPFLERIFSKNKECFGSVLLDTLNYYLIYGRDQLAQNRASLQMFFRMADAAIHTSTDKIAINNSDGALLLQVVLQIFKGSDLLNEFLGAALDRVLERLKSPNAAQSPSLKKHLLQVFLAALYYNPTAALKYMKEKNILKDVLLEIFALKKEFREPFEQKCFVMGMTSILDAVGPEADCPDEVKHPNTLGKLLQEIIDMLTSMQKREEKQAKTTGMKQLHEALDGDAFDGDAYFDSDYDSDEEGYEDEEDLDYGDQVGKEDDMGTPASKASPEEEVKASDQQMDLDGGDGGISASVGANPSSLTDKQSRELAAIDDFETKIDLKTTIDLLKTPLNKIDEFAAFNEHMRTWIRVNQALLPAVMAALGPE